MAKTSSDMSSTYKRRCRANARTGGDDERRSRLAFGCRDVSVGSVMVAQ